MADRKCMALLNLVVDYGCDERVSSDQAAEYVLMHRTTAAICFCMSLSATTSQARVRAMGLRSICVPSDITRLEAAEPSLSSRRAR